MQRHAFDQTGDINGQQLHRLTGLNPLPAFVKQASGGDIYGDDELQAHQYAHQRRRLFPCHTGPATYVSTLFFLDKQASIPPEEAAYIESRLDQFAHYHGITDSINDLKTRLTDNVKQADVTNLATLPEEDFALVLRANESPSGKVERHYPLRNALETKQAAEWLQRFHPELPYKYRQRIASRVLEKAGVYGASLGDLEDYLHKQAGHGACDSEEAAQFVFDRARLLSQMGQSDHAKIVGEVALALSQSKVAAQDNDQMVKLAILIDELDRDSGLNRRLELPPAEDTFFALTAKMASELVAEHVTTPSGNYYKRSDIDRLKLADVRSFMGDEFAEAVATGGIMISAEKLAEVVPTLPRGDAELFDRMMSAVGLTPAAKEAALGDYGFSEPELRALLGG